VIEGYEFCQEVENVETGESDKPTQDVVIVACGELEVAPVEEGKDE
jgi:hypothetical protein